ncbi:MAG TPA: hypothetical protein VMT34_08680 [Aggregatilineales bacterium]|nr:hypothetical protein [Aggregatilineales bacterium]
MSIKQFSLRCALALFMAIAALASAVTPAHAQAQNTDQVPVTRTVGMLDSDGSALYSVLFESATAPLGNLTITSALPADTTFVEAVSAPDGAGILTAPDGKSVSWQFANLDADTILGPFTYRVKAADPSVAFPAGVSAEVSWTTPSAGAVNAAPADGILQPLETSGQLAVDAKGTIDDQGQPRMVPVGHTGISVYVPAGALPQSVTLTVTREALIAQSGSAELDNQFWWCAGFSVNSTPPVTLAQPIQLTEPTRQVLTPYMSSQVFSHDATTGKWQVANDSLSSTVLPDGSHIIFQVGGNLAAPVSLTGAAGHTGMMPVLNLQRPKAEGCNDSYCLRAGVRQASRKKSQVKAPVITQNIASGPATSVPGFALKLLEAVYPTCYLTSSGTTRCTVYVGGEYQGYVEYPGQVSF